MPDGLYCAANWRPTGAGNLTTQPGPTHGRGHERHRGTPGAIDSLAAARAAGRLPRARAPRLPALDGRDLLRHRGLVLRHHDPLPAAPPRRGGLPRDRARRARRPWWVVPLAVAASVHAAALMRPVPVPVASGPGPAVRLTEFNLLVDNTRYGEVVDYLRGQRPDVLVTVETNWGWQKALRGLSDLLPYTTTDMVKRPADLELVVMSRFPIKAVSPEITRGAHSGVLGTLALRVVLDVTGTELVLWALHPPSPLDWWSWHARNAYHLWVAERAAAEDATTPVIVAGDYNQTPWTPWHERFLERSGLIDAAGTSWPAPTRHPFWPFAWRAIAIPIDRISVRPGTGVGDLHVGPFLGSDHYPVTADLVLGRPPVAAG